jgi:hypothetical protein
VLSIAGLLLLEAPAIVQAQPTAFTYQGQLKDGGSAANGAYDMVFRLFDSELVGNQVGADLPIPSVAVAGGLFTAAIDFGAGMFDGTPRWLEIEVNTVVLAPRQALTSTPYAQRASDAQSCNIANYANAPWIPSGADLYYLNGNIGIGTTTPTAKLEIAGTAGVDGIKFPDGTLQTSATEGVASFWSQSGQNIFSNNAGYVGIGTGAPDGKLHVSGGPIWTSNSWTKALNISDLHAIELGGGATNKFGVGTSGNSLYFFQTAANAAESPANYYMSVHPNGNVLVGTIGATPPAAKLDIAATGDGAALLRLSTERPWTFKQAYSGSGTALRLQPDTGLKNFEIAAAGGTIVATFEGNDAAPRLVVNGTTSTKVLQITGADLAEKFPTSGGQVEPGTVMEIDPNNPGLLRKARGAYNQRVAGVVSGANDFPAGAILGHLPGSDNEPPIALSGRVWVNCDASKCPISPGDLLTTSSMPGRAMKAVDRERSHGAVIGKAMTTLALGEKGLVLVLVNLQ